MPWWAESGLPYTRRLQIHLNKVGRTIAAETGVGMEVSEGCAKATLEGKGQHLVMDWVPAEGEVEVPGFWLVQ